MTVSPSSTGKNKITLPYKVKLFSVFRPCQCFYALDCVVLIIFGTISKATVKRLEAFLKRSFKRFGMIMLFKVQVGRFEITGN